MYGLAGGFAAAAAHDAAEADRPAWAWLFGVYTAALTPVYYALQWRALRE